MALGVVEDRLMFGSAATSHGQTTVKRSVRGIMGYSRNRPGQDGRPRYTAYYWDLRGRECSAGTFRRKKDADRAWQAAEARVAEGRATDLRRGRQRFGST
jgi:hypothetical protein